MSRSAIVFVLGLAILADAGRALAQQVGVALGQYPAVSTAQEQKLALAAAGVGVPTHPNLVGASPWSQGVVERIERSIRLANVNDLGCLRRPVSTARISGLQADLARQFGRNISLAQAQAMTDYCQTLLREAPRSSLLARLERAVHRPTLFGTVAELAEARERDMVLTRNSQSRVFDLTEARPRPRSVQMKIYQDELRSVRAVLADLRGVTWQGRRGIVTQTALDLAEQAGLLRRRTIHSTFYIPTDGSRARLMASKAFLTVQEARSYSEQGRMVLTRLIEPEARGTARAMGSSAGVAQGAVGLWLIMKTAPSTYEDVLELLNPATRSEGAYLRLGQHGMETIAGGALVIEGGITAASTFSRVAANSSRLAAVSRWPGPVGWTMLAGAEGFQIWQWNAGYLTDRQFYAGQAHFGGVVVGGLAGGWVGAKAGALAGGGIGFLVAGPPGAAIGGSIGVVVGALGGGYGGGYLGSWAAGSAVGTYFDFKDQQQERDYVRFLRAHYGL